MNAHNAVSSTPAPAAGPVAPSRAFRRRVTDNEVVLIVDDSPENLSVLGDLLQNAGYRVKVANSGRAALHFADKAPVPSLILLDIMMPDIDGHEVLRQLRSQQSTRDIPVIFLTAKNTGEDEEWAFSAGVADYIVKPFRPAIILARVRSQLLVRQARHWLVGQNQALEAEVERRMRENQEIQNVSIRALAHLAETRDYETGKHIQRTQEYVRVLAAHLTTNPRFASTLTPGYIDTLVRSAPLHDIGKVGIPDHILLKPGRLTDAEREIMKTHTTLGSNAIATAEEEASTDVAFLAQAKEIARWHHERWDGKGYPDGLSGEGIPISARLMALADVFDALISRRIYKDAIDFSSVRDIIIAEQGKQFDPDVAQVFLDHWEEFEAIALHYGLDR
ncbi:HD domain-containing phosphohydrolase [uncultured Propionivibrio sp.]|uniref:response regulator n=1 Tax=uncultured Propionivibrio sp. TaxID=426737 RepID=UPI0029C0F108|nr:HD domain-containing phosphohydrolase [uncultured Propionivibrio sp.]